MELSRHSDSFSKFDKKLFLYRLPASTLRVNISPNQTKYWHSRPPQCTCHGVCGLVLICWGSLPSLISVYAAVCPEHSAPNRVLPGARPHHTVKQGFLLWPLATGWPLAPSLFLCIRTRTLPGLHLKMCYSIQDAAALVPNDRENWSTSDLLLVWFLTGDSHIWCIMLSSLCLSVCLSIFSLCPSSLLLFLSCPSLSYSSFQLRLGPKMENGQSFCCGKGGVMWCDK